VRRCISFPAGLPGCELALPCSSWAPAPALPPRKEEGSFSNASPGMVSWWVLAEDRCGFSSVPEGCGEETGRSKAGLGCSGGAVALVLQVEDADVATPGHCVCPGRGVCEADGRTGKMSPLFLMQEPLSLPPSPSAWAC